MGLGGIGQAIRDIVDKLREKVDEGILWVIDKIKAGLDWLIGLAKAGIKKLTDWWKKEVPLDAGDEKHTLKFSGSGATAILIVSSNPQRVREFVREFLTVQGTEAQVAQANQLDDEISQTQKAIVAAEKAEDEAKVDTLSSKLDDQLARLATILLSLVSGNDQGSEKQPILIDYPKRRAAAYQDIYIGPKVGEGIRINQDWLRDVAGKNTAKEELGKRKPELTKNAKFNAWDGVVRKLSPVVQVGVDGETVGLSPEFSLLGPGKVLLYSEHEGTGGGGRINNIFKPYGFVPSSRGGEGLDGDHVMERQIGGPDELRNLWPLDRSENRSSGSLVKSLKCVYKGKEMTIHEARDLRNKKTMYLLIRSVRSD